MRLSWNARTALCVVKFVCIARCNLGMTLNIEAI